MYTHIYVEKTGLNRLKSKMRFHCKNFKPNVNHRVLRSRRGCNEKQRPVNDKFFHRATRDHDETRQAFREHAKIHARLREIRWNYFNQGNELAAAFNCEPRNFVSSRDETLLCAKDLLWKDMSGFWKSRLTSDVNPWCNSSNRLSSPKDQIILWKKTFSKNRENTKGFLNDQKFRFRQVPRN